MRCSTRIRNNPRTRHARCAFAGVCERRSPGIAIPGSLLDVGLIRVIASHRGRQGWQSLGFRKQGYDSMPCRVDRNTTPAERIELFRIDTPAMRAFHLSWMAFFLCFFAWFGLAPLMPVIREE